MHLAASLAQCQLAPVVGVVAPEGGPGQTMMPRPLALVVEDPVLRKILVQEEERGHEVLAPKLQDHPANRLVVAQSLDLLNETSLRDDLVEVLSHRETLGVVPGPRHPRGMTQETDDAGNSRRLRPQERAQPQATWKN